MKVTVEPVLFFYMCATYTQYPVMQDLIFQKVCRGHFNETLCQNLTDKDAERVVQKETSHWILYSTIVMTIPSVIACLFTGSWADTYGRKIPLILPSLGSILGQTINIVISVYPTAAVEWILVSSTLSGLLGGFACVLMACLSYVAELSGERQRTCRVSWVEAMLFLGGTIGPFLGGSMMEQTGHAPVFGVIVALHVVLVLYVALFVENICGHGEQNMSLKMQAMHWVYSVKSMLRVRSGYSRAIILIMTLSTFINSFVVAGVMDTSYLYVKSAPLSWSLSMYGYYFGVSYGLSSLALMLIGVLLQRYRISDVLLGVLGFSSRAASLIMLSFSRTTAAMFIIPFVGILSSWVSPSIKSIVSKRVSSDDQGKVLGVLICGEIVSLLFASAVFNSLYPILREVYGGLIFLLAAGMLSIPLTLFGVTFYLEKRERLYKALEEDLGASIDS